MGDLGSAIRPVWERANRWTSVHTVVFAWAMYLGTYVVVWARAPALADSLAVTLLLAFLWTGWATRWAAGVTIVAAASLLWWLTGFRGVELEFGGPVYADAFATFLVGTILLGAGRIGRIAFDASRRSAAKHEELAAAEARAAFQAQFLNMAAHEISTPLTPIKLQLATLMPKAPEHAEGLERIQRNVDRLERLTKDLADAGRLQQGTMRLGMHDVDLALLIRDVLTDASSAATEKDMQWLVDLPDELMVRADGQRLEQVVWNLVRNAIRYTPEGGTIQVRAWQEDGTCLQVQDNGLGMTQQQIAQAGTPFTQFHRETVHEGTGLGLFITKGIVAAHGGSIHLESAGPNQGTTVTLRLPPKP